MCFACKLKISVAEIKISLATLAVILLPTSISFAQVENAKKDSTVIETAQHDSTLLNLLGRVTQLEQNNSINSHDLEISEVIVSSMISKHGNDFFDYFTSNFSWPSANGSYIILISEKPFRTNTTQILIKVNDLEVFQNVLQPRASYLEELALYAQAITKQYILNYQQIMQDLESTDRSGTGIY